MRPMDEIYLDNNATTRVAPEVLDAMMPYWRDEYGNASSLHGIGQRARHAVERAREQVAGLIGAEPRRIVFTSGGTESDNLAILGVLAASSRRRHLVTTSVEHVAVHDLCNGLSKRGYRVTFVGVDARGHLDLEAFDAAFDDETVLASVMHANNETGVIFPIREAAGIAASHGVPLHVDAAQTAGRIAVDVEPPGASLMSFSAHKMHGPKGAGALYVAPGVRLRAQLVGGHQEHDLRPGTENVAAIVGFGAAAELAAGRQASAGPRVAGLRDRLEKAILERASFAAVIGDPDGRLPNTTNIGFEGLQAEAVLIALSEAGLCVGAGSACSSGSLEPSHVLSAMGIDRRVADGAVRFSLSHETTGDEIERAVAIVERVANRLAAVGAP